MPSTTELSQPFQLRERRFDRPKFMTRKFMTRKFMTRKYMTRKYMTRNAFYKCNTFMSHTCFISSLTPFLPFRYSMKWKLVSVSASSFLSSSFCSLFFFLSFSLFFFSLFFSLSLFLFLSLQYIVNTERTAAIYELSWIVFEVSKQEWGEERKEEINK